MLSSTTSFDWSQHQMNGTIENPARSMPSSFQLRTAVGDVRKPPGSATAADQQAAAAAAPLKCPRCDSSNTKFCYYNNYSLSQPRHFCKACKRYWTRGGTLRNVPVGGGCRKTKQRVRQPSIKPSITGQRNGHDNGSDQTARSKRLMEQPNPVLNGFLYGKNSTNMDIFNTFGADSRANGYNQTHNLGLGFSPGNYMSNQSSNSSYLSAYSSIFGSGLSPPFPTGVYSASPLMRSTIGSGFEYEKFVDETSSQNKGYMGNFQSTLPLEDMNIGANDQGSVRGSVQKGQLGQIKISQMESLSPSSEDPSIHNWNHGTSSNMNIWPDASNNMDSSVMSLL